MKKQRITSDVPLLYRVLMFLLFAAIGSIVGLVCYSIVSIAIKK